MKTFFVTGTDTAVGKTVVSRALLQCFIQAGLSSVGYKPVAKGCFATEAGMRNKDALLLQAASNLELPYEAINPVTLPEEEISGGKATALNYRRLSAGLHRLREQAECVVVEGSGGWRCLMNDLRPLSEWVVKEQLPVILVVGIKPGCISHALLTAQAIINDGLPLSGWVANRINPGVAPYMTIVQVLRNKINAPLLGELPYLPRAEQRDLSHYFNLALLDVPVAK